MKIRNQIAGIILFLSLLACVSQPAAPMNFDPASLSTVVVMTANAATTQTAAAAPTQPVEITPSPPRTGGTTIEKLPDGGTKYTDNEVGIEVIFPEGWLTLRPNSDEFNAALVNEAAKNDMLRPQMELDLREYEPGLDRLLSYPLRPDIEKNFAFGFSSLKWDPEDSVPINDNSMGGLIRNFESSGAIPGFRVDTAQIYETGNQVNLIEMGGQFSLSNDQGGVTPFYITAVFFKPTGSSTVRISFVYLKNYKSPLYEDVTSVINSIKLLNE